MSLVQMTLAGGVFILFIVVVRVLALHRLPKAAFLALWEMAALRLLLPFTIPLPFSVLTPIEHLTAAGGVPVPAPSNVGTSGTLAPAGTASGPALTLIWLAGAALTAVYFAVLYLRARQRFRASVPVATPAVREWLATRSLRRPLEVRQSDQVSSPLTYGVLRPVILLPRDMERGGGASLTYILAHEFVHVRRFDALTKLVFAAVLCVHWFNPLVWVMFVLAGRDLELSCDEQVMDELGSRTRAPYALTLIAMEEARSRCVSLHNYFSKLAIEERIEGIMKYKKPSLLATALAAALVVGATTTAFAASLTGDTEFGHFTTNEDGSQEPIASGQVAGTARFSVDKDGRCTPDPDENLSALLEALAIPEPQFGQDGDMRLIAKDQGELEEEPSFLPPTRTEEEWQQIIADIESGKIPPFEMPDDPNVTVSFVDYPNGSCTAGE